MDIYKKGVVDFGVCLGKLPENEVHVLGSGQCELFCDIRIAVGEIAESEHGGFGSERVSDAADSQ